MNNIELKPITISEKMNKFLNDCLHDHQKMIRKENMKNQLVTHKQIGEIMYACVHFSVNVCVTN